MAKELGHPGVCNQVSNTLAAVWQSNTAQLLKVLKKTYHRAYFIAHWKSIRQAALPWVESWYFIQESESTKLEHLKSLGIKARADFRKQLAAYERLKKSQVVFSPALTKLAASEANTSSPASAKVN